MGDSGPEGPFYASNGASGKRVLSVGNSNSGVAEVAVIGINFFVKNSTATASIGYEVLNEPIAPEYNGPIVPLTLDPNVTNDACEPLTSAVPNRTEAVILVRMGGCDLLTKQQNLINVNANNILFYENPGDAEWHTYISRFASAVMTIPAEAGVAIVETYLAGGHVTGNFTGLEYSQTQVGYASDPHEINNVTSWGPLYDLSIKPEISAPGMGVTSTAMDDAWMTLLFQGGQTTWGYASAAYIAGVAALYIGEKGGRKTNARFNASDLAMRIVTSGRPAELIGNSPWPAAAVAQAGTGLVNASKLFDYSTSLSYVKFELNDTQHFQGAQSVDITNNAAVDATYTFSLVPVAGYETWDPSSHSISSLVELVSVSLVPTVQFPKNFKVAAGEVKTAKYVNLTS